MSNEMQTNLSAAVLAEALASAPPLVVLLRGSERRIVFASRSFCDKSTFKEPLGRPLAEVFPEFECLQPLLEQVAQQQRQASGSAEPIAACCDHLAANGPMEVLVLPLSAEADGGGADIAVFAQELAESVPRYFGSLQVQDLKWFCEVSHSLLAVVDIDGCYKRVSRTFTQLLGWSAEEMLAQPIINFVHYADRERTAGELQRLSKGRENAGFENRLLHKNGSYLWISWTAVPALDQGMIYAVGHDISATKDAHEALRRQATANAFRVALGDRLRSLENSQEIQSEAVQVIAEYFGATRVSVGFLKPEEQAVIVEEEYVRGAPSAVGTHSTEAFAKPFAQEVQPDGTLVINDIETDSRFAPEDREVYRHLKMRAFIVVLLRRKDELQAVLTVCDSSPRAWTEWELWLIHEAAERVWSAVRRAEAEEALQRANVQLIDNDARKDEFLAMLAHELRNPLAAVNSAVHLLGADLPADRSRQCVDVLQRQVMLLDGLVNDLLDVSRVTRGVVVLKEELVDMRVVLERALECAGPRLSEKQLNVTTRLPADPAMIIGDPMRLEQVMVNLLVNAAKYTDQNGAVVVAIDLHDDNVEVHVRDTGIGIAEESQERIFALFGQVERGLDRGEGGLGIGLTLVKTLVELHKGMVSVRSEGLGKGAEFTVTLPRTMASEAPAVLAPPETATEQGRRILIVEDNADVADTLAMLLQEGGHQVSTAYDGPSALEVADTLLPDVILLDIGLPGMDGYEVARRLRQKHDTRHTKLAALTGYGQESDRRLTRCAGFDAHFVKPVSFQTLDSFVRNDIS